MRGRVIGGVAVAGMAALAALTLLPVVDARAMAANPSAAVRVEVPGTNVCVDVALDIEADASVSRPLLDVAGVRRVGEVLVGELHLVADHACGEAPVVVAEVGPGCEDDERSALLDSAATLALCGAGGVGTEWDGTTATVVGSVSGSLPGGFVTGARWCTPVTVIAEAHEASGGGESVTAEATATELCVEL